MQVNHNEHDEELEKVLAALRDAAPPEGMDARIAQRLQAASAEPAASRWRDVVASLMLSSEWARGAATGATAALLVAAAVFFFAGHRLHVRGEHTQIAMQSQAPSRVMPVAHPLNSSPARASAAPCTNSSHTREIAEIRPSDDPLAAVQAPSHPAPALGLTAQERALVRLVQTADPKQLAALDAEAQARSQADNDAQFEKFFEQPAYAQPVPPAPTNNE